MFDSTWTQTSATPLPSTISLPRARALLHDFESIIRLSPDCRGCKPAARNPNLPTPPGGAPTTPPTPSTAPQHYEVEDDLPFIPKSLWSGGVKYMADFVAVEDGCDITVYAAAGFTSVCHWRLVQEEGDGEGWMVRIEADNRCTQPFAGLVRGFMKSSHLQLQRAFIEKLEAEPAAVVAA